jgi:2-isopropylmalate synthase
MSTDVDVPVAVPAPKQPLIVFDTTLRDGEQSPGATLNIEEKLEIARQLSRLGVDVCEAGFPIASPGDFEAVRRIAQEIGPITEGRKSGQPMTIAGLARANETDILRAFDAVKVAPRHRIHTFLATSDIHLKYKLKMDREECIDQVIKAVTYAKSLCGDIEFSPEDAGRSDPEFLTVVLGEAIKAGATTLNIPDTVGYTTPEEYGWLIKYLIENTPGADKVTWSTHCHNDLGLATANTLAGVQKRGAAGGSDAERHWRAGRETQPGRSGYDRGHPPQNFPVFSNIDTTQIVRTSRMVSAYTGMPIQPNKAIVGANAFAHEAGIHQDGMLKHHTTYEIMRPETVGLGSSSLVLGKHSGRHAFRKRLEELGYDNLSKEDINQAFDRFKRIADKKKVVTDADIEAIITDEFYQPTEIWKLNSIHVTAGDHIKSTATVSLTAPPARYWKTRPLAPGRWMPSTKPSTGCVAVPNILTEFVVQAVTEGIDATGEVTIRIQPINGHSEFSTHPQTGKQVARTFSGHGASTDILVACARAYMSALNKMLSARQETSAVVSQQTDSLQG